MSTNINPDKALIFRIVHRINAPWILSHGIYCRNSATQDPNYCTIGNPELIEKRHYRDVPIAPNGTLSDYIPFYFTPFTPMMLNIKTGYAGITKVPNEDVVIFVSSLHNLTKLAIPFVFTDRHAYLFNAEYYSNLENINQIDWHILQKRDFRRDPDDPGKVERYQAEALVHNHMPIESFIGVVCYTDSVKEQLSQIANANGLNLKIIKETRWYL